MRLLTGKGFHNAMIQVFITAAVFYVALVLLMYVLQRSFVYYPDTYMPSPREAGVPEMTEVRFATEDGLELKAWSAPPRDPAKAWVVLFHGNAGTIASRSFKARVFLDAGYGVMLVEYRGYGGNPGEPTEAGLFADGRAALTHLADQGVSGRKLALYGESLGTGVAVAMAAEAAGHGRAVGAVLLEAPFTNTADVAAKHYPFLPARLLMKDRFDNLARIQAIHAPLFVVHGDQDWTVPQTLGRKLFAAAEEPKEALWVEDGSHNTLFDANLVAHALAFLQRHAAGAAAAKSP